LFRLDGIAERKYRSAEVEAILRDDPTITMLVNNAGVAAVAPLLNADIRKIGRHDRPQHYGPHP